MTENQSRLFEIPKNMKAWVLGGPDELFLREKPPWNLFKIFKIQQ